MKEYLKNRMEVLRGKTLDKWRSLVTPFLFYKSKDGTIKKNVPKEIVLWSIILVIGLNFIFYSQSYGKELTRFLSDKPVLSSISSLIYKISWKKDFEMEELKQEIELSKIKEDRANVKAEESNLARENAEEKTQEEVKKRAQAEVAKGVSDQKAKEEESKRKQEELARQVAEQEVLAKEMEEEKMSADKDGDGLSYRQELDQGTLDTDMDSDGDNINDNEDAHPAGGGRKDPQYFEWSYGGTTWTWTHSIHDDWYQYYKNKTRTSHGLEYVTEEDPFIKEIAKMFKEESNREGYATSLFIASFVQGLSYVEDYYTSFDEYPKYPIETFIDRNGDCEDTSYLAASIINASGYGSALVELPGHMAIAVKAVSSYDGYYYQLNDGRYYFLETTNDKFKLGDMSPEYKDEKAKVTRVSDGSVFYIFPQYEKPCDVSSDFSGYYTDGNDIYSDSNCNNIIYCVFYEDWYYDYRFKNFYWDSNCNQIVVKGCSKSTSPSGYFIKSGEYYYDSQCSQQARVCRLSTYSYDKYWDGYDFYWDGNCSQRVVSGCSKSSLYLGYFYNGANWYYDYQCTQVADLW
ncbi:MAG: MAP7 domain-containing protein [Candidatus Nealsonbacteria bacterium]